MTTPAYYLRGGEEYQPRVIAKRLGLTFDEGNALKYLLRAGHKPGVSRLDDLEKLLKAVQDMIADERADTPEPFVGVRCPATAGECKGRCVGATCDRLERATVVRVSLGSNLESLCSEYPEGWVGTYQGRRYGGGMIDGEVYLSPVVDVGDR